MSYTSIHLQVHTDRKISEARHTRPSKNKKKKSIHAAADWMALVRRLLRLLATSTLGGMEERVVMPLPVAMRTDSDSDARGNPCIYPTLSKI